MSLKSIFDLPTSKDQLEASNAGFSSWKWLQKAPLRNISDSDTTTNFNKGVITYRWDMASSTYFMPSKCFLRMRCKLTKGDNTTRLKQSDGIALSMGTMANLMSEMNVTINDQQISVADRHIGEIEAMYTRLNRGGQFMRDCGQSVNQWEASLKKRIQDVSIDGDLSDLNSLSNNMQVIASSSLGFAANATLQVTAADHVLTFVNDNGVNAQIQAGDILVFKDNITPEVFQRAFYVIHNLTNATTQLASFGTTIAADFPAAAQLVSNVPFTIYRAGGASTQLYEAMTAVASQLSATVGNVWTVNNAGTGRDLAIGDVMVAAQNAGTIHNGATIINELTDTTGSDASFNVRTVLNNNAANVNTILRYKNTEVTNTIDLGYEQSTAAANGHAVNVAINATGDPILTITQLGTGSAIPDVKDHFKVGDIVVASLQAGPYFRGFVSAVDPSGNGRSLSVIGEQNLLAAKGGAADARNYLLYRIRHASTGSDNENRARQLQTIELNWTPRCLSFFRIPHSLPGGAKYQLNITPKNLYKEAAIESILNKTVRANGVANDYNFQVLEMFLYIPTFEGQPRIDKTEFYLDLNEIRCQKVSITSQETSATLDVRPSTNALAVAVQSSDVDNVTNFSSSKFTSENDYQQKLTAFHIRYGAEQKPIPDFDIQFNDTNGGTNPGRDYWNEIYLRNLLASGAYFDSTCEDIQEYYERGNYIYQIWNRDASDRETRVYIKYSFSEAPGDNNNPKLLLFNFYKKYGICRLENGRYQEILINEA